VKSSTVAANDGIAEVWEFVARSARRYCLLKERIFNLTTKLSLRTRSVAKSAGEFVFGQADNQ